ncbi:MAG: cysteine rich repeat-containing protein [Hyphomicrobium sp.]
MKILSLAAFLIAIPAIAFAQTPTAQPSTTAPAAAAPSGAAPAVAAPATSAAPVAVAPADAAKQEHAGREKFRAACGADIEKLCAGIERAKGQIRACLESNKDKLGSTCNEMLAARAAKSKS